jgi:predicted phage terminase large subunit-like protein
MGELDGKPYNVFVTIDPAFTTGDLNDYTGIVVNAVTGDDRWHIMKAYRARLNPTALVEELFSLKRMWGSRLRGFAMEKTAHTLALFPAIEMKEKEYQMRLDITDVTPFRRKKEDRIRALVPKLEQGGIVFSHYSEDLIEEILSFPRGAHEDTLDALAYQLDIAHSGGLPKPGQKGPAVQVIKPRFGRRN